MCSNEQVLAQKHRESHEIMDSSTPTPDRSINGLIFFLTLSLFLTALTSGLLVCLSKIWCSQRKSSAQSSSRRPTVGAGGSFDDSDSDDEALPPSRPPAVRRLSQRLISFVHRPFQEETRQPPIEESPEPPLTTAPAIHGAEDEVTSAHSRNNINTLPLNDPTCVIYL
ncbi:unnamed protein product [Cylicocyclus nassatus]|uniref:Uncharacterized protein n=1 Tax=Cylicocyclus nassatus TaxID=53992 RepID=A0AA36HIN2_CYLNA|nr:unnamed protein product [Cylicocyclus nassatus]